VGEFTDVHLKGHMTKLGSGQMNTVYIGTYKLPNNKGRYEGVFKPEGAKPPDAGIASGISSLDIRAGYRNVATTRLDEALGFGGLTTRSEMAIHNHKLGTVSEKAEGVSPTGMRLGNEQVPDREIQKIMGDPYGGGRVTEAILWMRNGMGFSTKVGKVDGKPGYYYQRLFAISISGIPLCAATW
jgi:hypothetical protein